MLRGLFIFGAGVRPGPGPDLVPFWQRKNRKLPMVGDGDQGGMTVPPHGGESSQFLPFFALAFSI